MAMSIYATVTKRDLAGWSTFLFMGLIGIVIASVVNIFTKSSMLLVRVGGRGGGLHRAHRLRHPAASPHGGGGSGVAALPVNGALSLYLNFINLFLSLLNLFGGRRS